MACGTCGATQDVDLGAVSAGCNQIDAALDMFNQAKSLVGKARSQLGSNSLRFGGEASTLEEALDILDTQIAQCSFANAGVTGTITGKANEQKAQWNAHMIHLAEEEKQKNK